MRDAEYDSMPVEAVVAPVAEESKLRPHDELIVPMEMCAANGVAVDVCWSSLEPNEDHRHADSVDGSHFMPSRISSVDMCALCESIPTECNFAADEDDE
jgi:hypothetical protein